MGGDGDSAAGLRVTLLGAFEVRRDDTAVPIPGTRLRGLVTRLALTGGRPVGAAALIDALWPEDRPADPGNALQSLVSRLRRMLGTAGAVVQVEGGYRLAVTTGDVDAARFERLAADGRERLRTGDPGAAAGLLGEATALWGEPSAIAEVAPAVAIRLTHAAAGADLAEAELALGRSDTAAARLWGLLAGHPADERAAALLMDALAAQGRQAEALDVYERVRAELADRLGADPGTALRERHLRLLTAADTPTVEPAVDVTPPSNLPASLTSFVGRDDDLTRLDSLLATGRLVTVVGPGGAGKTRIALEAGRRHRHEYRDGTWLIDLSSVTEPAKVGAAVLAAIGARGAALFEKSGLIRADGGELEALADQLNGRETLLVVDNCEHLIDAVAHLIVALLSRCAGLRVLATSREPLAVDGEALVPLGPLTLPEADDTVEQARRTASVRLFTERAAAVRPGFDVDETTLSEIVRVVRGLDGLPLALELAAARLRTLSLAELRAGLSDRFRLLTTGNRTAFPRHRTLRAVIAWSWDLLGAHERTVAERISVLPGGVTPASATAVCAGTDVSATDVPELLAGLVDRSILQLAPEPGRYRMLETLREYGIDRLTEQGTLGAVRDLAARHLSELISTHDPRLRGPDQLDALRVMRAEYDNALAALRHLCDTGDTDAAVTFATSLTGYWQMFGRPGDASYWLAEVLALPFTEHTLARDCAEAVRLLSRVTEPATAVTDHHEEHQAELQALAERLLAYPSLPGVAGALAAVTLFILRETEPALAIINRLIDADDVWMSGLAYLFRGQIAENQGDVEGMRRYVDGALDRFGRLGERWGQATALPMRALVRQYDGDLDGALADLRRARVLAREFGSLSLSDEIFIDLRWMDLSARRGDFDHAVALMAGVRERARRSASPEMVILVDALEAGLWVQAGELDRGRELVERAEAGMTVMFPRGGDHGGAIIGSVRAALCVREGDGPGAEAALTRAYAAAVETHDMPVLSVVAVTAAGLAQFHGRFDDAAQLLGAAARLRGAHDRTDRQIGVLIARSRDALGGEGFAEAYESGWQLDGKTASALIDPARLRRETLPVADSASPPDAQARRA